VGTPETVAVNCVQSNGYPSCEYVGLMSSSSKVKSPTSVEVVPTSVLLPAVLARIWSRSG
jgi:hypothetical protein